MRTGTLTVIWSDGSGEQQIEPGQITEARKHDPQLRIKPPYRMQQVSPAGNTVVKQFTGQAGEPGGPPPRWQQEGAYLGAGDPTQSTPFLNAIGNNARYAAAGLPQQTAYVAPLAIPGEGLIPAVQRILAGFGGGTVADAADRAIQGRPQNLGASLRSGTTNAATQTVSEVAPPVGKALGKRMAPGASKLALGKAPLGAAKETLAFKLPMTEEGMAMNQQAINALREQKTAAALGSSESFDPTELENVMKGMVSRASKSDLLNHSEDGLGRALQTLQEKIAEHYTPVSPKTTIRTSTRPTWHGNPGGGITRDVVGKPTMTASELDDINRFAEKAASDLYEGRTTVNGVPIPAAKIPQPSQAELAYKQIADATNNMLHRIPEILKVDTEMSRRIALKEPMRKAIERGAPNFVPALIGQAASVGGYAAGHSLPMAGVGLPAYLAARHLGSPEGLQQLALLLQNPAPAEATRYLPRMGAAFAQPYLSPHDRRRP